LDPEFIESLASEENLGNPSIHALRDYLNDRSQPLNSFLRLHLVTINVDIPSYIPVQTPPLNRLFAEVRPPQFNNTAKWLEDLCGLVVEFSPSIAVRACQKIVKHSFPFRTEIFPITFLSCWQRAHPDDRVIFSRVMESIFEMKAHVDPAFFRLAELLVRAGCPLDISNFVIASACPSPAQALRFLVRHFRENPSDYQGIELMLTLNMRLGQIQSSRGILKTVVLPTAGTWYEKLGEWESAL
jgi:hypothetical protein